jgi:hypothetical protein
MTARVRSSTAATAASWTAWREPRWRMCSPVATTVLMRETSSSSRARSCWRLSASSALWAIWTSSSRASSSKARGASAANSSTAHTSP